VKGGASREALSVLRCITGITLILTLSIHLLRYINNIVSVDSLDLSLSFLGRYVDSLDDNFSIVLFRVIVLRY
jgi:hypothetical protein